MNDATQFGGAMNRPDHVPQALVYDFDMFRDPDYILDPHARIAELVRQTPDLFWTPRNGGHWMFISYAVNFQAARDTETFSSEFRSQEQIAAMKAMLPEGTPYIPQSVPITLDPPMHGKYRAPLQGAFSPKTIMAMKDEIRELANRLIDQVIDRGRCDFMTDIAEPLPVLVFLKMMGLPLDRMAEFRHLVQQFLATSFDDNAQLVITIQAVAQSMLGTIIERRDAPRDDLISLLWATTIDGEPLSIEDMQNYCFLLFIAGLDTVMNGMGFGMRHLARDQALQSKLRENPELITEASEELLRRYSFTIPTRRVAHDTEFAGVRFKKDDIVMLCLPAADLDPREFSDPDQFDLGRVNKVHIAFNAGPHRCLGSHLARVELQIIYEQMLSRLPEFSLDAEQPAKFHCGNVIGIDSLPIVWGG